MLEIIRSGNSPFEEAMSQQVSAKLNGRVLDEKKLKLVKLTPAERKIVEVIQQTVKEYLKKPWELGKACIFSYHYLTCYTKSLNNLGKISYGTENLFSESLIHLIAVLVLFPDRIPEDKSTQDTSTMAEELPEKSQRFIENFKQSFQKEQKHLNGDKMGQDLLAIGSENLTEKERVTLKASLQENLLFAREMVTLATIMNQESRFSNLFIKDITGRAKDLIMSEDKQALSKFIFSLLDKEEDLSPKIQFLYKKFPSFFNEFALISDVSDLKPILSKCIDICQEQLKTKCDHITFTKLVCGLIGAPRLWSR